MPQKKEIDAKYGTVYLKSDKDRYQPGEQFTGIIYLNLLLNYPGDLLSLQFKGTEKWMYAWKSHSKKTTTRHFRNGKEVIIDIKVPVHKNHGSEFLPGQYAFPISFLIPSNIPASVYHEGDAFITSIEIRVKAILETLDPEAPKMKYKEILIIEEGRKQVGTPLQKQETIMLKECCCTYGQTSISLALEKEALTPGETAKMKFSADNSLGKRSVESIKCQLIEETIFKGYSSFQLKHHSISINLPGFGERAPKQEHVVELTLPSFDPLTYKSQRIPYKRLQFQFEEIYKHNYRDDTITPSSEGKIVKIKHYLAVELIYESCTCCFNNPIINIPVQINFPPFTSAPLNQVPEYWNPKVMPTANLAFDAQPGEGTNSGPVKDTGLIAEMQMNNNQMKSQQPYDANTNGGNGIELQLKY